jgi:Rod binding domain-containing protein
MPSIDPTSTLGSEPLTPPPGLKLDTPEQQQLYRASLEFERVFVQQLLKPMDDAGKMFSDDEDDGDSSTGSISGYQDMANDQMTQAVLDGGGLGIASSLYTQLAESAGVDINATTSKPAAATSGEAAS